MTDLILAKCMVNIDFLHFIVLMDDEEVGMGMFHINFEEHSFHGGQMPYEVTGIQL